MYYLRKSAYLFIIFSLTATCHSAAEDLQRLSIKYSHKMICSPSLSSSIQNMVPLNGVIDGIYLKAIKNPKYVIEIDLSSNYIEDSGVEELTRLSGLPLKYLNLSMNYLGQQAVIELLLSYERLLQSDSFEMLDLSGNPGACAKIIMDFLQEMKKNK